MSLPVRCICSYIGYLVTVVEYQAFFLNSLTTGRNSSFSVATFILHTCSLYEQGMCMTYFQPLDIVHVGFDAELAVWDRPFCVVKYTYLADCYSSQISRERLGCLRKRSINTEYPLTVATSSQTCTDSY